MKGQHQQARLHLNWTQKASEKKELHVFTKYHILLRRTKQQSFNFCTWMNLLLELLHTQTCVFHRRARYCARLRCMFCIHDSVVLHIHPSLKKKSCCYLIALSGQINFSISRAFGVTSVTLNAFIHLFWCSVCSTSVTLGSTSIPAAADSGLETAVDQMWKRSVNGGELEGKVLSACTSPLSLILLLLQSFWADQPVKECEIAALGSHPSNLPGRPWQDGENEPHSKLQLQKQWKNLC